MTALRAHSTQTLSWFATCPKGLEGLLREELLGFGALDVKETVAGVSFVGPLSSGYRACLWSRLATQILLPLTEFACSSVEDLYAGTHSIPWSDHLSPRETIAVRYSGNLAGINNTQFGAQRVKDAIVDAARAHFGARPSVSRRDPDLRIAARVHRGRASIALNLSGESLHRRGYRQISGEAPLKENLAAALVLRSRWLDAPDERLIDPLCGSGTLLIEAAEMRLGWPPAFRRERWGFERWRGHEPATWSEIREEGQVYVKEFPVTDDLPPLSGYDAVQSAVAAARLNLRSAGLEGHIEFQNRTVDQLVLGDAKGLVLTNPPYGERLGDAPSLVPLYDSLGALLQSSPGIRGAIFTANPELGRAVGLAAERVYRLPNGALPARLLLFGRDAVGSNARVRSAGAEMFANRLRKKARQLDRWATRSQVDCYRLYDADLPEYAFAVDRYLDWVHVSEYRAPPSVDEEAAVRRLNEAVMCLPQVLGVSSHRIVVKQRSRQRGHQQYERRASTEHALEVREGPARLLVNLRDYLDTGLFLDHRPLRLRLAELCRGKRFLNLYCYTSAATVQAALGGAKESVSIDLSRTYLEWAQRNLSLNDIDARSHRLVRADCVEWLARGSARFDVILLDPPTFSNSSRMEASLDVQRDHAKLIELAGRRLAQNGLLVFSTNRRRFEFAPEVANDWKVEDVTHWSLGRDFVRTRRPHHCWFLTRNLLPPKH